MASTESARGVDVDASLASALEHLQRAQRALRAQRIRRVTIDLDDPEHRHAYYLLSDVLAEDASRRRDDVDQGVSNDPEADLEMADDAAWIIDLVEASLEDEGDLS